MNSISYLIPNISCGHCTHKIIARLSQISGVEEVQASVDTKIVEVDFTDPATPDQILAALMEINYPPAR